MSLRLDRWFLVSLLLSSMLAFGCGNDSDEDSTSSSGRSGFDRDACASFVLPHRMGFRWETLNHRVSRWSFALGRDRGECRAHQLKVGVVGGNFSTGEGIGTIDTPKVAYGYQTYQRAQPDPIGVAYDSWSVTIVPDASERRMNTTVTLERSALELEQYSTIVPLIAGFDLNTGIEQSEDYPDDYKPDRGYTLAGWGASVETVEATEETVTLRYQLRFQPGASADREPHNRAVPKARIQGRLDIMLVGAPNRVVHTGSTNYTLAYEEPDPGDGPLAPASSEQASIELEGRPEGPRGLWGLQSFDLTLDPRISCEDDLDCPEGDTCRTSEKSCRERYGPPGFYMRALSVDLTLAEYDASTGRARFEFQGFASNTSEIISYYPLHSTVSGRMAWFQVEGAGEPIRGERAFETGETSFELRDLTSSSP